MPSTGNVYLTGLSGAGKSSVAPILAERLHWSHLDTDDLIAEAMGIDVAEIFSTFGEAVFRRQESEMIERIATLLREVVVSLGGGAIVSERNRACMKQSGTIVYLKAQPESLARRLTEGAALRPLLKSDDGDVAGRLAKLLAEREGFYAEAQLTIECDELTVEEIVARIAAHIA